MSSNQVETLNRPHHSRFKLQGRNRFLARVHTNKEYVAAGGIIIPDTKATQDIPTTGEVVAISDCFDAELYPDVKPGAQIKVVINSWSTFDCLGETLAVGDADYVIATYDPF